MFRLSPVCRRTLTAFTAVVSFSILTMDLPAPGRATGPTAATGQFAVEIGGEFTGVARSAKGGIIEGEVAVEEQQLGPTVLQKKHLSSIGYESFTVEIGMGMSPPFYDWITASLDRTFPTRSGQVIAVGVDYQAMNAREFRDAFVTEVSFPALDGSSKDPAYLSVTMTPQSISYKGGEPLSSKPAETGRRKKFLASNFRVKLGDLPCERVSKVDSFTWKQSVVVDDETGEFRLPDVEPAKIEVPNLKFTISAADIAPWQDWYRDFVIEGQSSDSDELTGSIVYLAPDLSTELGRVELLNVGIVSLDIGGANENKAKAATFTAELYCEDVRFHYGAAER